MTIQQQTTDKNTTTSYHCDLTPATSTSTSSVHTEPGVSAFDLDRIRQAYVNVLGPLNMFKAEAIEKAIDAGLEADAIMEAIKETAMARRPSHYYLAAILTRYMNDGLTTKAKIDAERFARRRERFISNRQRWSDWYESPEDAVPW